MARNDTPTFISSWLKTLNDATFAEVAPDPEATAIFSADMINGFLYEGPLASDRVKALARPVASVFKDAWDHGVREFLLLQDTHDPSTPEFRAYPPHCVVGTSESATIPDLSKLPFADSFTVIEKNSLNPAVEATFDDWLDAHPQIVNAIVVGDCTDLCTYQLAMHLRMRANALNLQKFDVIVPANAVDTFDIPAAGTEVGQAHPGDFFHNVFLYHMMSNGIRIVRSLGNDAD
ncbi:MAG: isochorismatase family protein [Chloroflexota bacterium]|nr:isochorismatase family protein [Chloroflexota bacterium]